jgi:hypothetical protein
MKSEAERYDFKDAIAGPVSLLRATPSTVDKLSSIKD